MAGGIGECSSASPDAALMYSAQHCCDLADAEPGFSLREQLPVAFALRANFHQSGRLRPRLRPRLIAGDLLPLPEQWS
jgi:hypothetical protein